MRATAVFLTALVVSLSGSLAVSSQSDQADTSKMSTELVSRLNSSDEIEVIIQFTRPPDQNIWNSIQLTGITVESELSVLYGALIKGNVEQISKISQYPFVKHLEANVPIEHFYLPGDQNDYN